MKHCTKCGVLLDKCNSYSQDGRLRATCKKCHAAAHQVWREKNRDRDRRYTKKWREKNAEKVRAYSTQSNRRHVAILAMIKSERPCYDCGAMLPPECMDFDHVRGSKVRDISDMSTATDSRIWEEINKCQLVCSNCHRIRTRQRRNITS